MLLSDKLLSRIQQHLGNADIAHVSHISGGNINRVYCIDVATGKYLLKLNSKDQFPGMFACEAAGLKVIADTKTIAVPRVIAYDDVDKESFLLLEWIETRRPTSKASESLGRQLAAMHNCSSDYFGLNADNYMGSLSQSNRHHQSWAQFYIYERLVPMVKMAVCKKLLNATDQQNFENLYARLVGFFDEERPALSSTVIFGAAIT